MTKDMIVKAAQEAAARRNEVFALNDLRNMPCWRC